MPLTLGTAYVRILPSMAGFSGALTAGVAGVATTLAQVGASATLALTAPIVAAAAISVNEARKFETAFAGVRKTVDATESEFGVLKQGIIDMANVMPASREEIAKVVEAAGRFGVANKDLLTFTDTAIKLGVATSLSADQAAEQLTRFANITGVSGEAFKNLGASIVALGNDFPTTEAEIANFSRRLAGAATVAGIGTADILGFSAGLASVGIRAEAGGTAFSRVFLKMNDAIAQGGEKLEIFSRVSGQSVEQFTAQWRQRPTDAVLAFIKGLQGIIRSGGDVTGTLESLQLNEIRVRDALLRTALGYGTLEDAILLANEAWFEGTALEEEAAKRFATFDSQLKIFKNRLTNVARTIGEALLPILSEVIVSMQPFVNWLQRGAEAFAGLDESTRTTVARVLAIVAAFGPLVFIATRLGGAILTLATGFLTLGRFLVFNPIGLLITAIGVAAWLMWQNWEKVGPLIMGFWEEVQERARPALEWLRENAAKVWDRARETAQVAYDWFTGTFLPWWEGTMWPAMQRIWGSLSNLGGQVWNGTRAAAEALYSWFTGTFLPWWEETFWPAMQRVWGWLSENAPKVWSAIQTAATTLYDWFSGTFLPWFQETFGPEFMRIWSTIRDNIGPIILNIATIIRQIGGAIAYIIYVALPGFKKEWDRFWPTIAPIVEIAWLAVGGVVRFWTGWISGLLKVWAGLLTGDWGKMWDGIKTIASTIWQQILTLWRIFLAGVRAVMSAQMASVQAVWAAIWPAMRVAANVGIGLLRIAIAPFLGLMGAMRAAIQFIIDTAKKVWPALRDMFTKSPVTGPVLGAIGVIIGALNRLAGAARVAKGAVDAAISAAKSQGPGGSTTPFGLAREAFDWVTGNQFGGGLQSGVLSSVNERGQELMMVGRASTIYPTRVWEGIQSIVSALEQGGTVGGGAGLVIQEVNVGSKRDANELAWELDRWWWKARGRN